MRGVIKTTAQTEYYTPLEDIEHIFKQVADPIAFACQVKSGKMTSSFIIKKKLECKLL